MSTYSALCDIVFACQKLLTLKSHSHPPSLPLYDFQVLAPFHQPRNARVYSHRARSRHVHFLHSDSDPDLTLWLKQQQSVPLELGVRKSSGMLRSGSVDNLDELNETEKVKCAHTYFFSYLSKLTFDYFPGLHFIILFITPRFLCPTNSNKDYSVCNERRLHPMFSSLSLSFPAIFV